jgi:glutamate dehydrogenase (NAD(P)+)
MTHYEDLEALASQMSYKASFHNVPFGGAKGCIYIDPKNYTYEEKVKIVRRFTIELWKRSMIGASTDVMGVDIGTDDKIMNIIRDTYKNVISNNTTELDACVTGKGISSGGLESSKIASGFGTARCLKFIQENSKNKILAESRLGSGGSTKSIILHGLTNNSINFINFLNPKDFKVIGIIDGEFGCFNAMGFNVNEVDNYRKKNGSLEGISKILYKPEEIISKKCDIYVACKEQLVTGLMAENLNCKLIVEAANLPLRIDEEFRT